MGFLFFHNQEPDLTMAKVIWRSAVETGFKAFPKMIAMDEPSILKEILKSPTQPRPLVPFIDGDDDVSAKEELILYLKFAAEIEHALMAQYLYAANSLPDPNDKLRRVLLDIAIQEMGHFLAVQNLLLLFGGLREVHLHRNLIRPKKGEANPLPFTLEKISKNLLAKFVAVEAPPTPPGELSEELEKIRQIAIAVAGVDINPVGELYNKIFWLIQKDDNPHELIPLVPDATKGLIAGRHLSAGDCDPQAVELFAPLYDSWDFSGSIGRYDLKLPKTAIKDQEDALKVVYEISAQGEGANLSDEVPSHFESFLLSYRSFDGETLTVVNLPDNPVTGENSEYETSIKIENKYSLLWCSLFNHCYESLLLDIHASIFFKQFDPTDELVRIVFDNMKRIVGILPRIIHKLPLDDNGFRFESEPRAAAPYEVPGDFKLSTDRAEVEQMNSVVVQKIQNDLTQIQVHPDFATHRSKDSANINLVLGQITIYCQNKTGLISSILT